MHPSFNGQCCAIKCDPPYTSPTRSKSIMISAVACIKLPSATE